MKKKLSNEDKAGLYLTAIVHLGVVIVLLIAGLGYSLRGEQKYVLDFSALEQLEKMQEEVDRLEKEVAFKQSIKDKIDEELGKTSAIRGVAVNRSALKDDRGTDADKLYKDAERLSKELNSGFSAPDEEHAELAPKIKEEKKKSEAENYSGPSVISYELDGRKASHLPIPAYRCMGAGEVKVIITVNPKGDVIGAKVDESASSTDGCLRSFAIRASRLSKFSAKSGAPAKQIGNIVYQFVAQ